MNGLSLLVIDSFLELQGGNSQTTNKIYFGVKEKV